MSAQPLERVFQLGATDHRRVLSLALAAALLGHGGMAGAIRVRADEFLAAPPMLAAQEISIEREPPPPPPLPPPPPPQPEPPSPPPPVPAPADPHVIAPAAEPSDNPYDQPASEAAQAGEVVTQESDDDSEEDDDKDNTFVTGDAGSYAGGMTMTHGTSTAAVRGSIVADGGVPGGTGTPALGPPPPPARDRSRSAWLMGNSSWDDCDFPGEADRDKIRDAVVQMTVTVRPNGTAQSVSILEDPGHGFARTAMACALRHQFAPALDASGHRIVGTTRPFHIGFHR